MMRWAASAVPSNPSPRSTTVVLPTSSTTLWTDTPVPESINRKVPPTVPAESAKPSRRNLFVAPGIQTDVGAVTASAVRTFVTSGKDTSPRAPGNLRIISLFLDAPQRPRHRARPRPGEKQIAVLLRGQNAGAQIDHNRFADFQLH